ncbi:MAG: rRNA maturation RNase YbeY [Lachnospiraceae bacterium]|nr:rRNA maturation RNase YbeY [Lachnospiraceae bacterium]
MTINIEVEKNLESDFDINEVAGLVIEEAIDYVGCPYECEINLLLTDNDEIRSINKEYRNIDKATDVLSFPMAEYERPGDFEGIEESQPDCFNPETGELILGDIIISVDKVYEQAREYNHSIKREYAFLIAHSMLHLCGFDHMEADDAIIMEEHQKNILNKIRIFRD